MKNTLRVLLILTSVLLFAFCSKSESDTYEEREQLALDTWVKLHVNDQGGNAVKQDNGLWIETLRSASTKNYPETGDYIRINYQGTLLDGSVFMTTSPEQAEEENTYSWYTNYVPWYGIFNNSNGIMEGMLYALETMSPGDSLRLYMPYRFGYTYSGLYTAYGFGGHTSVPSGLPSIVDIALVDIVKDPSAYEKEVVDKYALTNFNQVPADTVYQNFYLKYDPALDPAAKYDTVLTDSTAKMYYIAKFAENDFILDTNIGSVGHAAHRDTSAYALLDPSTTTLIDAFTKLIEDGKIVYDSKFKMVFTSDYGYGSTGNYSSITSGSATETTIIQPYSPLIFEVTVMPKGYGEEEDE